MSNMKGGEFRMYWNGTLELYLVKKTLNYCLFINVINNELIKASNVVFEGDNCHWARGEYFGDVSNYIKV
jgi:hypothetical protein